MTGRRFSIIEGGRFVKSYILSQFKKSKPGISEISRFCTVRADRARLRGHRILERVLKRRTGTVQNRELCDIRALDSLTLRLCVI